MQKKSNDTPKIIGLAAAIVAVLSFGFWQIARVTQTSAVAENVSQPRPAADNPAPPPLTVASAAAPAGPGQMRYFDDALDADPPEGQSPLISSIRSDAFRAIKPPPPVPPVLIVSKPPPRRNDDYPLFLGQPTRIPTGPPPSPTLLTPVLDIKLDGVVTGPEGFAMLTIHEFGARDAGAEQNVYRRVGERVANFVIERIQENGIVLKERERPWLVGQTLRFGQRASVGPSASSRMMTAPITPLPPSASPANGTAVLPEADR